MPCTTSHFRNRYTFSGVHHILAECLNPQRSPQPVYLHSSCAKASAVCGSPWVRCSGCCWRFRSSFSGWSLPQMPSFSLQRCQTFRSFGQTCVEAGKWAMPFVSCFSLGHSHCLLSRWHLTRTQSVGFINKVYPSNPPDTRCLSRLQVYASPSGPILNCYPWLLDPGTNLSKTNLQ
jgi:hypothetical protein